MLSHIDAREITFPSSLRITKDSAIDPFPVIKQNYVYVVLSVSSVGLSSDLSKLRIVLRSTHLELAIGVRSEGSPLWTVSLTLLLANFHTFLQDANQMCLQEAFPDHPL